METYYSEEELKGLGLKKYGLNVKISRHAIIYRPEELEIGSNVRIDDLEIIYILRRPAGYMAATQG